ncbi:MAG: response regulator [Acidobacteriota bacterium]
MSTDPAIRVLVVDDDPVCRRLLRHTLESAGMAVEEAEDLPSARLAVAGSKADVMILDYQLPGGTGLDVWESARTTRSNLARKTIMLTGALDPPERMKMADDIALPVLGKPFQKEILLQMVEQLAQD